MSKTLDRIGLLLNQAENASTPEEASAFMEKAQHLATIAAVDLEVARRRQADKTKRETPTQRNVPVAEKTEGRYETKMVTSQWSGNTFEREVYVKGRVQNNAAEFVNLFHAIARNNDVQINIAHNSTYVIAFGFPSDIEVCEALFASLKVQMVAAADAEIKKGDYKAEQVWSERAWKHKPLDARTFRTRFYEAFVLEIGRRLREARKAALETAKEQTFDLDVEVDGVVTTEHSDGALVLVSKAVEVRDYYKSTSTAKGSWKGGSGRSTAYSNTAAERGAAAGRSARLGTEKGITTGPSRLTG